MNILQEWLAESTVFDTYFHFFCIFFSKLASPGIFSKNRTQGLTFVLDLILFLKMNDDLISMVLVVAFFWAILAAYMVLKAIALVREPIRDWMVRKAWKAWKPEMKRLPVTAEGVAFTSAQLAWISAMDAEMNVGYTSFQTLKALENATDLAWNALDDAERAWLEAEISRNRTPGLTFVLGLLEYPHDEN